MSILFISQARFPEGGSADVTRLRNMTKIFRENQEEVFVIARGVHTAYEQRDWGDISYVSLRSSSESILARTLDLVLFNMRVKRYIMIMGKKWDKIYLYNVSNSLVKYIKGYAAKNNSQVIIDCDEWFSKEEYKLGRLDYAYISNNHLMCHLIDKDVKVVAISTYLEKYFNSKGIKNVRIPVIMDIDDMEFEKNVDGNKKIFMYAGSPGGKDSLDVMIDGFRYLSSADKEKVEFWIVGVDWEWIKKKYRYSVEEVEEMKKYIKAFGRVLREEVCERLSRTDFTVLLRPEHLRYAKAGFPTKVVESLASGTPVVCNLTSDLGMYIRDGVNGFIVEKYDSKCFSEVLHRCIQISSDTMEEMFAESRKSSESFNYKKFISYCDLL